MRLAKPKPWAHSAATGHTETADYQTALARVGLARLFRLYTLTQRKFQHAVTHHNVIEFPKHNATDGPRFIAWRYDRGELSIHVEGFDSQTDGEMLLSWSPEIGVEIGEPTILVLSGEPSMLLFKGSFEEHSKFFSQVWGKLAEENERPAIFDEDGLAELIRLPKLPQPPLPAMGEERTAHANTILEEARARIAEIGKGRDLTLEDCNDILDAVTSKMGDPRVA